MDRSQPVQSGRPFQIDDLTKVIVGASHGSALRVAFELGGLRTVLSVPLVRDGVVFGRILAGRQEVCPFSEHQIGVLQGFADQAVIAIENVRLFNETQEALERQTATADILKVIASSPSDVQPVFDAIAARSKRLVNALSTAVHHIVDGVMHLAAFTPISPEADATLQAMFPAPLSNFSWAESIRRGQIYRVTDTENEREELRNLARKRGWRSCLCVPLLRDGKPIGMIAPTRAEPGPFADHDVQLLQTFADQAVIAIENVRLFNETQEALERQTATADILKVIASSPSDVQPVFDAIAERSNRLIEGLSTAVYSIVDDALHLMAFTRTNPEADAALQASFPRPLSSASWGERVRNGESVQISDFDATVEATENAEVREMARLRGFRSLLFVPLRREGIIIGMIGVSRPEPGAFAPNHVQLLQTFADQAVIAIGNVRLFDEVQAKTRDLSEALTYQTGSGNILSVIASSPTDVGPVLKAIVETACELCDALDAIVLLEEGDSLRNSAHHGPIPTVSARWGEGVVPLAMERWPITRKWVAGRAFLDQKSVHVHDMLSVEGDEFPDTRERARRTSTRTYLCVPLVREGKSIGTILLRRTEVNPFSEKQIALLQTFADQAVIAIGNVRLFEEVQAKTRDLTESLQQQTATADVLKIISRSSVDLETVLDTLVETVMHLCRADQAVMHSRQDDKYHLVAECGLSAEAKEFILAHPPTADRGTISGRAASERRTVHIPDILDDPGYTYTEGRGSPATARVSAFLCCAKIPSSGYSLSPASTSSHLRTRKWSWSPASPIRR